MTNFFQSNFGISPEEKQLSVSGRNWGEVDLNGQWLCLSFQVDGSNGFLLFIFMLLNIFYLIVCFWSNFAQYFPKL